MPPSLIRDTGQLRISRPALTALDLGGTDLGGDAIDTVLRTRAARLSDLHHALELTAGRRGNAALRVLLLDSRDEPWSAAERAGHRLLRADGLTGWRSNHPILVAGQYFYLDIAFPAARLAIEIDGRGAHDGPQAFEADRWRQNWIVLHDWRVLRFTWRAITDEPDLVLHMIRLALSGRSA